MHTPARGFTLLELLMVIAIIGILSEIVLASLSQTRSKGADAAVISDLKTIQTQAAIYQSTDGTYGVGVTATAADCTAGVFSDSTLTKALGGITDRGVTPICILLSDGSNATGYVAAASLVSDTTKYFCVDSAGAATSTTVAPTVSSTACGN